MNGIILIGWIMNIMKITKYKMDKNLETYIKDCILFIGMAGTGKSEILSEAQLILEKNNAFKMFMTACPTHKACKIVIGENNS